MGPWPPSNSRARHWMMQIALCIIFGGTLALAGLLKRHFDHLQQVKLTEVRQVGSMRLRQPAGWKTVQSPDGIVLEEPPSDRRIGRRRLRITHAQCRVFMSPLEYLVRSGELRPRDAAAILAGDSEDDPRLKAITVAGWPGIMSRSQNRAVRRQGSKNIAIPVKQVLACAVLPSSDAIVIQLDGEGALTPADEALVREVGESIELDRKPRLVQTDHVAMDSGIRVMVPSGMLAAEPDDPPREPEDSLRESRSMVLADNTGWLAVDLVPCIVLPTDGPEMLASMMLWRDPLFRPAQTAQVDANTWMCQGREDMTTAVSYLRLSGDGRGLLAEFRWVRSGGSHQSDLAWVDAVWQSISANVEFLTPPTAIEDLVRAGDEAVAQLPHDPVALIDQEDEDLKSQWQWYHETQPRETRAIVQYRLDPQTLQGFVGTADWPPLSASGEERAHWAIRRDVAPLDYTYELGRAGAPEAHSQETEVRGGGYQTIIFQNRAPIWRIRGRVPSNFIPGGLLGEAMACMPNSRVVISTESILSPGLSCSPMLLRVVIEPADDLPQTLAGRPPQKLRGYRVHVSGSSNSSRWYVDGSGQLQWITFAGGIHLRRLGVEEQKAP